MTRWSRARRTMPALQTPQLRVHGTVWRRTGTRERPGSFKIIAGVGGGSQTVKQQDLTATAMHHPGGRWLVGSVGLAAARCSRSPGCW
jgi:Domain of Unknown Function (DUF1206)